MNKALKAALLSIFVFPGAGHYSLKKKQQAYVAMIIAFICLYVFLSKLFAQVQTIVDQIMLGELPADLMSITAAVHEQVTQAGQSMSLEVIIFILVWIGSSIDAYRLGIKEDKTHQ